MAQPHDVGEELAPQPLPEVRCPWLVRLVGQEGSCVYAISISFSKAFAQSTVSTAGCQCHA
jgi:hypothetical protein